MQSKPEGMRAAKKRVLIAGMGNILKRDDGFGVEVARRLMMEELPEGAEAIEVGIGGMSLVQKLLDGYDSLIIADTVVRGGAPGTLYLIEPEVPQVDLREPDLDMLNYLADEHCVEPSKVLLLAKALGASPKRILLVGCEPAIHGELGVGLSGPVKMAVEKAIDLVQKTIVEDSQ